MPPESDNSRVVDVLQWSDLFVSCMSSASAVEGQDALTDFQLLKLRYFPTFEEFRGVQVREPH